jgi:threonine aldolase
VFVALTNHLSAILSAAEVEYFELRPRVARFVTSWQTDPDEVELFVRTLNQG